MDNYHRGGGRDVAERDPQQRQSKQAGEYIVPHWIEFYSERQLPDPDIVTDLVIFHVGTNNLYSATSSICRDINNLLHLACEKYPKSQNCYYRVYYHDLTLIFSTKQPEKPILFFLTFVEPFIVYIILISLHILHGTNLVETDSI